MLGHNSIDWVALDLAIMAGLIVFHFMRGGNGGTRRHDDGLFSSVDLLRR